MRAVGGTRTGPGYEKGGARLAGCPWGARRAGGAEPPARQAGGYRPPLEVLLSAVLAADCMDEAADDGDVDPARAPFTFW